MIWNWIIVLSLCFSSSPCMFTCRNDRTFDILATHSMWHTGNSFVLKVQRSCSCYQWIVSSKQEWQSLATAWATSRGLACNLAFWPFTNPFVHPCHCKRDVSQWPRGLAVLELEAKQRQLTAGQHLCSYKASLLFLHLNIVVGKKSMLAKNILKIQHLYFDGKRLTIVVYLFLFIFCISTLRWHPYLSSSLFFFLDFNLSLLFNLLHQSSWVAWRR